MSERGKPPSLSCVHHLLKALIMIKDLEKTGACSFFRDEGRGNMMKVYRRMND